MVRYKRYRRRYRSSTRSIMMKFQSFMDISTRKDEMQIISVNAGGKELLRRLPAQFAAYKYYRIGNIAVKLVPASTLPVDPTGLSLDTGESTVDPRDQLTPGMMRITNGEDVLEDLTGMSAENQHKLYNSMLLDPRWFKWMLQSGVKRHATPRYWQIGQLHQDKWPGSVINIPTLRADDSMLATGTSARQFYFPSESTDSSGVTGTGSNNEYVKNMSSPKGLFQVGHRGVLGWLPTDGLQYDIMGTEADAMIASPPEIEVMKLILPPAYKTKYYYRMFITETVYFREPVVQAVAVPDFPFRPLDIFHYQSVPVPEYPNVSNTGQDITDMSTGGNYGDD